MSDAIDFNFIGGWKKKAEADEENEVFHVTISNGNGNVTSKEGEELEEKTISFSLIKEESNEEDI